MKVCPSHGGLSVTCPEYCESCGLVDQVEELRWLLLDMMQYTTELVARLPRCRCPDDGVKTVVPSQAWRHSRFSLSLEAFAIEVLQARCTPKAAAALLGVSWDVTQTIMDGAVERSLEGRQAHPSPHVGIDEKSFGNRHDDITVLTASHGSCVLDVTPERTQAAAGAVLQALAVEQRQAVPAVAADLLPVPAYANVIGNQVLKAELSRDKFHVAKHLGEADDQARRAKNKARKTQEDDQLKGSRQLWVFNMANLSLAQRSCFAAIRRTGLKTAGAWVRQEDSAGSGGINPQ